ncbi:UdgX family uracil-DNA binding protein [Microvirga sp. c23x22]|uniref:Type-4 uracil-DNA glycosylase n=1 Tax=Microvirga terricola TaxID=2719797 RepID=A0ABX0VCN0_9HYPH|nr:UdgX family uracil-DNA binding protein [Microvirga terricola]
MPRKAPDAPWDEEPKDLAALNAAIDEAGPFVSGGTRAVFGEGPDHAALVFVGEQPGDQEDIQGRPFVGPAGRILSEAMEEAGLSRKKAYVTNAVKHFKFEQRGKRRLHARPSAGEVRRYRPFLMKEIDLVHPKLVVALGATAAQALAGRPVAVSRARGETRFGPYEGYVTVHPSYLLRVPDEAAKRAAYEAFVADLRRIRTLLEASPDAEKPPSMGKSKPPAK